MPNEINQKLGFEAGGAIKTLRSLAKVLGTAATAMSAFSKSAGTFNGSTKGFDASLKNLDSQINKLSASLKKLGTGLQAVPKGAKAAATQSNKFTTALKGVAKTAVRVLVIQKVMQAIRQLAAAIVAGVEASRKFELRLIEVQTLARGTQGSTESLSRKIQELSEEFGRSADAVAEGLYQTLSNQIEGASDAFGVLTQSMKLAAATASAPKDAINAISSVLNSYGLSASHATEVSDILFKTVELGRLRLSEIADIIGRVTPLSAKLGISFKETAAAIAVMTRQGVKANTAITQLRAVEQKLIKPTEKMAELFRRWGVQDGATAIKTFGGLTGVLKKMAVETGNNDAEMAALFSRVRAIVGEMALMTKEGQLMTDTLKQMDEAIGSTNEAWEKFANSDAQQMTNATEELNNAYKRAGKSLLTWILAFTKVKIATINFFTGLVGDVNGATTKVLSEVDRLRSEARTTEEERVANLGLPTEEELNAPLNTLRKVLANYQTEHNKTYDKMKQRVEAFVEGSRKSLKSMFSGLAATFKPIQEFLDNLDASLKSSVENSARLQDEIKVDKAALKGPAAEQRANKQIGTEATLAGLKALTSSHTDEQAETARDLIGYGESHLKAALSIAKAEGNITAQRRLQRKLISNKQDQLKAENSFRENAVDLESDAIKAAETIADLEANKNKLIDQRATLQRKVEGAFDPATRADLEEQIADISQQIIDVDTSGISAKLLEALDIPDASLNFATSLADAVAKADFEWKQIMDEAGDAFKSALIQAAEESGIENLLSKAIDKAGGADKFDFSKGVGALGNQGLDKLVKDSKEAQELQSQITGHQAEQNLELGIQQGLRKRINEEQKAAESRVDAVGGTGFVFTGPSDIAADQDESNDFSFLDDVAAKIQKIKDTTDTVAPTFRAAKDIIDSTSASLERNGVLSAEEATNLGRLGEALSQNTNPAFTNAKLVLEEMVNSLLKLNKSSAEAARKQALLEGSNLDEASDDLKDMSVNSLTLDENLQGVTQATEAQSQATSQASAKLKEEPGILSTITGWIGQATGAQRGHTSAVDQTTAALKRAELQAIRTAKAVAAASGGGSAKHFGGVQHLASGGLGQDTVSAMLTPGEFVVNKASTSKFFSDISAMNSGSKPIYREQGGDVTNVGDVNVTVNGGSSSQETARDIGYALKRELRRGTLKL